MKVARFARDPIIDTSVIQHNDRGMSMTLDGMFGGKYKNPRIINLDV